MKKLLAALFLLLPLCASAQIVPTLPVTLTNGTLADANQVMSNFNAIVTGVNTNAAKNGANSDITSLSALTTPLTPAEGGSSVYTGGGSGTANAQLVVTPTPINFILRSGNTVNFIPSATNTGPTTLGVAGTTVTTVLRQSAAGLVPLAGGEIFIGQVATVIYDGTQYELINSASNAGVQPCTEIDYKGTTVPTGYLSEDGTAKSRATFPTLFSCISVTGVAATLNSTTTVTVPNSALFQVGWFVGGSNITCNSTIQSIPGGGVTIVLNNAAGATGSSTLTIGPYSQGDCSTTFNLPNMAGRGSFGADPTGAVLTSTFCTNPGSIGSACGNQSYTMLQVNGANYTISVTGTVGGGTNIPTNTGTISNQASLTTGGGSNSYPQGSSAWGSTTTLSGAMTGPSGGSATPFGILPPIQLATKAIKF